MRKIDSADRERARARDTVRERERVGAREKERVRVREREREREGGGGEGGEKALPCGQVTVTLTQQQIVGFFVMGLFSFSPKLLRMFGTNCFSKLKPNRERGRDHYHWHPNTAGY